MVTSGSLVKRARLFVFAILLVCVLRPALAADARFDLIGPRVDVRVTRNGQTLPIASVPNLQPGDRLWLHPDLPATQSVKYLLICVFLRGTTNPPPDEWFTRIETWDKKVREEGTFVTVPAEAQQALLFLAPETGGDFSTLRSAVQGRPGAFVRASQDLTEAGFEQARIEKYVAEIRKVPPSDSSSLQKHSDLLARTLALKPNEDCFKRPIDTQFTCLTQSGSQIVLDDGHGQSVVNALSNGPGSDLITQASYTQAMGGGMYSAYVGAVVDVIRIMSNLHTAQYQYIPAISFPQGDAMNLRLNTPPSFHNPKSVLVIALPSVQTATPPPLRSADADSIACMIKPTVTLPIEGAPLVFSTDFAHDMVLHLNTPPGAPAEPDIPLVADAYDGGLRLQQGPRHHVPLRDPLTADGHAVGVQPVDLHRAGEPASKPTAPAPPQPMPVLLTGTIRGRWGFDSYTGPTVELQQLPGTDWHIVPAPGNPTGVLIAGRSEQLLLTATGTACVHTITARPTDSSATLEVPFKPEPQQSPAPTDHDLHPATLVLTLPLEHDVTPGDLHLAIQQYDQPEADQLSTRTFSEPAVVRSIEMHAGDRTLLLRGLRLNEIDTLHLGDLVLTPKPDAGDVVSPSPDAETTLHFAIAANAPTPNTHVDQQLTANLVLKDGRTLSLPVTVSAARPSLVLLHKTIAMPTGSIINLSSDDDLPLNAVLTFTVKSPAPFPRNGQIEIETLDGTLRTVLTLAPSGGLLLQDPHTVVATLDPLRSFGPSAFGALHMRAIYPLTTRKGAPAPTPTVASMEADEDNPAGTASDWLPLATLVRLPALTLLQCPTDASQSCTVTGKDLFLIDSLSIDPGFSTPVPVPDGFTGTSLMIPHPNASTVFLKLRDDPANIDSVLMPTPPPPVVAHAHHHAITGKPAGDGATASGGASTPGAASATGAPASATGASTQGAAPGTGTSETVTPASTTPTTTPSAVPACAPATGTGKKQKCPTNVPGTPATTPTVPPSSGGH
jgi:hypothetical protein